ncbi:MAG: metal-dependent hydrolase [Oligoflexia bacterium]|nr:metal-dependent hydrolase [Oligoflexia bacterium]
MTTLKLTFAGHSACFLEIQNSVIAIDPWLQENPSCPANLKMPPRIDLIVLTHGHADHASEAAALAKRLGSSIAATWELAMLMMAEGVPQSQVIPMNKGGTVSVNDVQLTLTHAFHSSSYDTPQGPRYAGEPCGVVLRSAGLSVYHAGDTALFGDMRLIGELYQPQLALLPIGDRFTMGPAEAALAAKLVGCKIAIPIHFNTFELLTGTAEEFKKFCAAQGVQAVVLEPGATHLI